MTRPDVIWLITETAGTRGVHDSVTETARMVYCTVRSVSRSEYYNALNAGIQPEVVFVLALSDEYQGERALRYHDQRYEVIRSYVTESDGIEITARRSDVR